MACEGMRKPFVDSAGVPVNNLNLQKEPMSNLMFDRVISCHRHAICCVLSVLFWLFTAACELNC